MSLGLLLGGVQKERTLGVNWSLLLASGKSNRAEQSSGEVAAVLMGRSDVKM